MKPERQKDKKLVVSDNADLKTNLSNNNIITNSPVQEIEESTETDKNSATDTTSFKIDKIVIKTESMTVKAECTNSETPLVKIEYATTVIKDEPEVINPEIVQNSTIKTEVIPIKIEPLDIKTEESSVIKIETQVEEIATEIKVEAFIKSSKDIEPLTTAVTPIAQLNSTVEGKENIPIIKTGDTASKNSPEIIEVPYKETPKVESVHNTFIHEVKKRKLDILKEGGLEVTPVRPTLMNTPIKDSSRPSVIHQASPPSFQLLSKSIKIDVMPPPTITTTPARRMSQSYNASQVKITPSKKQAPSTTNSFQYNSATPPKVLQSKSIYSYSEKTIYGNPKEILASPVQPVVPKFIGGIPRTGGDPVDLSVNSPQKPIVEIMRVPQVSLGSPYNRDSVTKNLYKSSTPNSLMDGRKLAPNLEITLVGPSKKNAPVMLKPYNYTPPVQQIQHQSPSSSSQYHTKKRFSSDYRPMSKIAKNDEKLHTYPGRPKLDTGSNQLKPTLPQAQPFAPPRVPVPPQFLPQLYEQAKGLSPYLPILDPAMYYSAALQSLYTSGALNSSPLLHVPTPEQLKFYADLMAHGRFNFPFPLPQDGTSSPRVNNNSKKQQP